MGRKLNLKNILMISLIFVLVSGGIFSTLSNKTTSHAASREIEDKQILEFLKEGYNAYWYIDESLDMEYTVEYNGKEYLKVNKNFYTGEDMKKYFEKFYSSKATSEFINRLSPKLIEGQLYVLAGEAGDKPYMNSAEIVDNNMKEGYITLKLKDNDRDDLYLRAYIVFEKEKMKIDKWKVL